MRESPMSSCRGAEKSSEPLASRCPSSGSTGVAVDRQTVKALLTEMALRRLEAAAYRFCPDPDCDVVYFDGDGSCFRSADVRVPVWQKEPFGARIICYCFAESEASIRTELDAHRISSVVERVRTHIEAGRCACDVRNPRGACCLGDLIAAVKRVEAARQPASSLDPVPEQPNVARTHVHDR
jgi:hypothetical protein